MKSIFTILASIFGIAFLLNSCATKEKKPAKETKIEKVVEEI